MTDDLIYFGDTVKSLDSGHIGGYLVRFTDADNPDLEGDFFTKATDLGAASFDGAKIPLYYHHGFDKELKKTRVGFGTIKLDDVGVWLDSQITLHDEYEDMINQLVAAGKLGYSSGATGHLVDREPVGKSNRISVWPVGEASLTPTPAEYRNAVIPVKSLLKTEQETPDPDPIEEDNMTEENKAVGQIDVDELFAKFKEEQAKAVDEAVTKALEEVRTQEPEVKASVQVVEDEADKTLKENPFKSGSEFFKAVYVADVFHKTDKRLLPLKATGVANEDIPSEGGFLVPNTVATGIEQNMWPVGNVLSRFNPIPVAGNSMSFRAVDETSRADGSRMGGIAAYWLAEAQQFTASQPKFRNIDLKLKKLAALVYATDELLADTAALEGWIVSEVPMELRFMVEDAIINGPGGGRPLGILQSDCLIEATRADANKVADEDIYGMWAHRMLGPQDYVWFINATVMPQLAGMTIGDTPVYQPPRGLADAPFGSLLGRPVIETEYNPYLGTVGDILLASPSQYKAITKSGGIESASSMHVRFDYDEMAFRFIYRFDGQPKYASSITAKDGTNTVSPFVALAATT